MHRLWRFKAFILGTGLMTLVLDPPVPLPIPWPSCC
jgi:hypothetical protein